jgi:hypothetical protein
MKEIRVIGDDVETIVNTAREFSKKYDYVFTSGLHFMNSQINRWNRSHS